MNYEEEITALKLKVGVLMRRRSGYRVSPSQWRQIAVNGLDMLREWSFQFGPHGTIGKGVQAHLNIARNTQDVLVEMNDTLKHISMAHIHAAGIAQVKISDDGRLVFDGDQLEDPVEIRRPGETRQHKGTEVWEFVPPPPHNGVVLICTPDMEANLGFRCYAEVKFKGGERKKFPLVFVSED